jgi:hypothetical protein
MNQPMKFSPEVIEKKMRIVSELFNFAFGLKWDQFRKKHPEKTEQEINHLTFESIQRGCR